MAQNVTRLRGLYARPIEQFPRQVEPVAIRVFQQIPQDIGELERRSERKGERFVVSPSGSDSAFLENTDRTGHPMAIEL